MLRNQQDLPDSLERIYMIGDNPLTDIQGANAAGAHWISVLTKTGMFPAHLDNHDEHPADLVFDHVQDAYDAIMSLEMKSP